jgi:hypothetical protein
MKAKEFDNLFETMRQVNREMADTMIADSDRRHRESQVVAERAAAALESLAHCFHGLLGHLVALSNRVGDQAVSLRQIAAAVDVNDVGQHAVRVVGEIVGGDGDVLA